MARAVEPLLLSISIDDAEKSEIDPLVPLSVAIARVKLTVPKSASEVSEQSCPLPLQTSGRSTIHSADDSTGADQEACVVEVHPFVESSI